MRFQLALSLSISAAAIEIFSALHFFFFQPFIIKNAATTEQMIDAQNQLELKVNASIYWTTSVNGDTSGLKEVYMPSLLWLTLFKDDSFGFF